MRKILILRGGALGDFIVTLPALALLRARWPSARIELIGNATAAALAMNRGLLDAAHSQHESRWSALFTSDPLPLTLAAWLAHFDLVINYWPDPDGALRRHFPRQEQQTFLTTDAMPSHAPAAAHYCEPLRTLGLTPRSYFHSLAPISRAGFVPALPTAPIALHPGSGSPRKNWPTSHWLELISRLDAPILLILGEAEHRWSRKPVLSEANGSSSGFPPHVRVLSQPPLESLISELSTCRLFLGHDSGISHLAAACGIPSVVLFGPTDPAIWAPPAPHVRVLQRGADLATISVDEVVASLATT